MTQSVIAAIVVNIDPVLLQVGPVAIRWYGLMYLVGIAVGVRVAMPYALAIGLNADQVLDAVTWGFVGGLLGGRLYYVVQQPLGPYLAEPWRILAVWEGGMAFFGAIFGVVVALFFYTRRHGLPFWRFLDASALFGAIGQPFGRIGNIINGDIVGYPTDLPWGFRYVHPGSFVADRTVAYHPAAIYEILANIVIIAILWRVRFRLPHPGALFALYLALYSITQFVVFFWRDNEIVGLGLKQAQFTAIVTLALAIALASYLSRRPEREPGAPADSAAVR